MCVNVPPCDHDWRADPRGFVYTSFPPARLVICARCRKTRFDYAEQNFVSRDPRDWEPV